MSKKKSKEVMVSDSGIEIKIEKKKKAPSSKIPLKTIIIVIIIVALAYIFTSTTQIDAVEQQNYTVMQPVTEQVPYTIAEEYQEREPFGLPYCGMTKMNFSATVPEVAFAEGGKIICSFNLTNLEAKEGIWEYSASLSGATGNRYDKETVGPGATKTFSFDFGISGGSPFSCGISVISLPSIEKCYFPEETFYKVVTKTRNVTKYRNVTTEKEVSVLNETPVKKNVNRFFGYEMPNLGW